MTLCRQKLLNMMLNMLQKPAERAKKRPIWTKINVFTVYQNYVHCAVTNAEKFEGFRGMNLNCNKLFIAS